MLAEVLRDVSTHGIEADMPIAADQLAGILALVEAGTISGKQAKEVYMRLRDEVRAGRSATTAEEVVRALGIVQVSDDAHDRGGVPRRGPREPQAGRRRSARASRRCSASSSASS